MERQPAAERLANALEMPVEAFSGAMKVTVTARGRVEIENYKSLIELSEQTVGVRGKGLVAVIEGSGLTLEAMNDRHMLITGTVCFVRWEEIGCTD
ncbi:MAG: YabP/YqfC family sporulation protein [Oscillospiraceae bacterium]|nr:YabP/YqfC family sporulation protein [Oscillospiraceae bacterium]MBQ8930260.1 YabP/YqfC family sporulation protein [Oscillospiraceae bacterium]